MTDTSRWSRQRIADVAAKMLAGEVDLLEGCRTIVSLLPGIPVDDRDDDDDLLTMVVIDSELDDIPLGRTRDLWEPTALARQEEKKARYLGVMHEEIMRACRSLVARWGQTLSTPDLT